MTIWVTLVVEDLLSEAVARVLLQQMSSQGCDYQVARCLGKKGVNPILKAIDGFHKASQGSCFFILTDQDRPEDCPSRVFAERIKGPKHPNFIWRFAVMEVESWVMAHADEFLKFLVVHSSSGRMQMLSNTDAIPDPKQFLVSLARKSRSTRITEALVPKKGSTSKVGPDYNETLSEFVSKIWKADIASGHSQSLRRAINHLLRRYHGSE